MVMLGTFVPENVPNFKRDSAVANAIKNINRELETNYTVDDFVNRKKLFEIRNNYMNIPLGLSESEREEFLRSTTERKLDELEPKKEELEMIRELQLEDQQSKAQPPRS